METVGGPDAKKARWSPTFPQAASPTATDAFSNYGYGPNASINQPGLHNGGNQQLYSTPSLSINTNTGGMNGNQQLSPNAAAGGFHQQQHSPSAGSPYANFGAYNMLGLGLPGMNMLGFPYNAQMGPFGQVRYLFLGAYVFL